MNKRNTANGDGLFVYCNEQDVDKCKDYVRRLIKDGYSAKHYINIGKILSMTKEELNNYNNQYDHWNFWMDIEHDFIFFIGEENKKNVELLIDTTIKMYPDKFPKPIVKFNIFDKIKKLFNKKQLASN